jgi:hypothetical protein
MFFGYNVGSALHKATSSDINLIYGITHTLTDNFISNLLDQNNLSIFVETSSGTRPENFVTIKEATKPPVFLDTWISNYDDSKKLGFMHIPGIINIPTIHAFDQNKITNSLVHICYDDQTLSYLQNLKIPTQLIPPAILPSFIQTNIDILHKNIDIGILQNSYPLDRLETILQTIKTSMPNYNIQIFYDNQTNEYLDNQLKQTKVLVTLDPVSPIDLTYATNFCNIIISTNLPANEIPNRVYTAQTLEVLLEKSNKILSEYDRLFNILSAEKNRLLLNNNFDNSRKIIISLLEHLSEKTKA